jgi:hypothetical protein
MRGRTWLPAKPKREPAPEVPSTVRTSIDAQVGPVVAKLKKRILSKSRVVSLNRPVDLFVRWYRNSLYFVLVLKTPHGRPPTLETHVARMEHAGDGLFNLAVPMRRGWNTFQRRITPEECLAEICECIHY